MRNAEGSISDAFPRGAIDNRNFHHVDHLRVAFDLLRRTGFAPAAATYCAGLQRIAAEAGRPEAFHMTMTLGFLSLIAERLEKTATCNFGDFTTAYPELLNKNVLQAFYSTQRLQSEAARRTFLLPETMR